MNEKYLIGVDLGTSATKAALYRTEGTLVAEVTAEVPIYYPRPGVVEQENDDFYRTAAHTIRECLAASGVEPRQVAAIAFDSQIMSRPPASTPGWTCAASRISSTWKRITGS